MQMPVYSGIPAGYKWLRLRVRVASTPKKGNAMSPSLRAQFLGWAAVCLSLSTFSAHAAFPADAACQVAEAGLTLARQAGQSSLCTFSGTIEAAVTPSFYATGPQVSVGSVSPDTLQLIYTDQAAYVSAGSSGLGGIETRSIGVTPASVYVSAAPGHVLTSATATAYWSGSLSGSAKIVGSDGYEIQGNGSYMDLEGQTVSWVLPIDAETGQVRFTGTKALGVFAPYATRGSLSVQKVELSFITSPVPEPQGAVMMALGLAALWGAVRRGSRGR